jgi:hypothetical protein
MKRQRWALPPWAFQSPKKAIGTFTHYAQTRKGTVVPFIPSTRCPEDDYPLAEREAEPRCFLVETIGFEPMTPCLQSRCSTN